MPERKKAGKLNIIEPWEFGTEKAINATLVDAFDGQYLIALPEPLSIKGKPISYLIGELVDEKSVDLFSYETTGTFALGMVYSTEVNGQNYKSFHIKDFRGNFLFGEIIFV